jgi:hypothetical protein
VDVGETTRQVVAGIARGIHARIVGEKSSVANLGPASSVGVSRTGWSVIPLDGKASFAHSTVTSLGTKVK